MTAPDRPLDAAALIERLATAPLDRAALEAAIEALGGPGATARALGVDQMSVRAWVGLRPGPRPSSRPSVAHLAALSRASGVPLESFVAP